MDFEPGMLMDAESAGVAAELIPDGLVAADGDGRIIFLNTRATRLLGRPREEIVGADIREAVDLQDSDGTSWWTVTNPWGGLRIRTGHREKLLMLRHSGREVLVTAKYLRPGRNQPVNRVNILMRDALYRRRAEAENAAVISTVAHELRSPLTSVKGFSSTLLRRWDRFSDDQKRLMIETIEADADRVTRLITELLDVSRIDSGRLELHRQVVDVPRAIRKAYEGHIAAGEPTERFVLQEHGTPPEMWLDPDKLDQIVGNLVENALRHGDGTIIVVVQATDAGVEVTVTDEGEGVDEDIQSMIFGKFWRGRRRRGGTGLGLYITKGLVEAHGGTITVGRAPSGGAQFRFTLPAGTPSFM